MNSREAFEAWADARDATHGGKLRNAANDFDYPLGRLLDECWQAAIQHARDVAVKQCLVMTAIRFPRNDFEHKHNEACDACADAIKEALK